MSEGLGCIVALAVIAFAIWLIGYLVAIVLYLLLIVPIYFVFLLYLGLRFVATNVFVLMDGLFYLGFDVPAIIVWVFWGFTIGAAIQGCRELRGIYGRKWFGGLTLLAPILMLILTGIIKNITDSPPSGSITPPVMEQNIVGSNTNMVLIPAGEFQMQSHWLAGTFYGKIYVEAFYIDKYEVTNAQYKKFIDSNPQWQKDQILDKYHDGNYLDYWDGNNYPIGKDNYPVTHVSWYAAMAYAQWADKRLPTEAEWEKAARGGLIGMEYPWGNSIDSSKANYDGNFNGPTPVGNYAENGYGLYDMSGNIWEWCLDANEYYATSRGKIIADVKPISVTAITDIVHNFTEAKNTTERALRGGGWDNYAPEVQVGSRHGLEPTFAYGELGFRCAKPVNPNIFHNK